MDEELKKKLEEIKRFVSEGKKDAALKDVNEMLSDNRFKPYEDALKKIKVDIIYAMNLERIDKNLGEKAYNKVVSELDSALGNTMTPHNQKAQPRSVGAPGFSQTKDKGAAPKSNKMTMTPSPPVPNVVVPVLPVPVVPIPKEIVEMDPYDIDKIDIEHEIGPLGILNDMRRTAISLFDPLLPIKMLEKEKKKKK